MLSGNDYDLFPRLPFANEEKAPLGWRTKGELSTLPAHNLHLLSTWFEASEIPVLAAVPGTEPHAHRDSGGSILIQTLNK